MKVSHRHIGPTLRAIAVIVIVHYHLMIMLLNEVRIYYKM